MHNTGSYFFMKFFTIDDIKDVNGRLWGSECGFGY